MVLSKKINIIISGILITSVIIICPRIWIFDWKESITLGATLLSGFTGVFAIILGYFIYKDLGIAKVISDKQIDCVFMFLEQLYSICYQAMFFLDKEIDLTSFNSLRTIYDVNFVSSKRESLNESLVLFSPQNFFDGFKEIERVIANPAMPPELLKNLKKYLEYSLPSSLIGVSEYEMNSKYKEHVKLVFLNSPITVNTIWTQRASGEVKIIDYITSLNNLVMETKSWLENNSNMKLN